MTTVLGWDPWPIFPPSTAANSNPAAGGVTRSVGAVAEGVGKELGVAGAWLNVVVVGWIEVCAMGPEALPHAVRISTSTSSARLMFALTRMHGFRYGLEQDRPHRTEAREHRAQEGARHPLKVVALFKVLDEPWIVEPPRRSTPAPPNSGAWARPGRQHFKVDSADLRLAVGGPGQAECPTAWLRKIYDVGTARIGQDRLRFT
jgi:hypothetical protein